MGGPLCSALDFQSGCQAKPDCRWGRGLFFLFVWLIGWFCFLVLEGGGVLALFFLFFSPCLFLFIFSQSQCLQLQLQNPYILPAGLQAMNYLPGLKEKVTAWDQLSISASLVSQSVSVHGFWEHIVELQISLSRFLLKVPLGTFLVVQCLRLHLPMQALWVRSRVGELRSYISCGQKPKA